jgi:GNAT superfamily N-acetyltransferase
VIAVDCLDGAEIKRVYVDPGVQGLGVGKALMAALESEAARRGVGEVTVESSLAADGFYAGLGYRTDERVSYRRGDAEFRCVSVSKTLGEAKRERAYGDGMSVPHTGV